MNQHKREQIFERLAKNTPNPTTELVFNSTFELLISVILSAQATDKSVNKATKILFKIANTPAGIYALGENQLKKYIKTIGLYNSKAKNIIKTCKLLTDLHNDEIPKDRITLETLPGVGRKTANVILNTAFNEPTIAVDTHVFRVSNRTKVATGKTVLEVEKKLVNFIPAAYRQDAHHLLILHGRYTCMARKPLCKECVMQDLCEYKNKTI